MFVEQVVMEQRLLSKVSRTGLLLLRVYRTAEVFRALVFPKREKLAPSIDEFAISIDSLRTSNNSKITGIATRTTPPILR